MTLLRPLAPIVLVLAACSACGDDGNGMTADAAPPDPCAPQMSFVGEFIDWDSGAAVVGIFGATYTLRSDPSITKVTPPNGRLDLCIPAMNGLVDINAMSGSDYVSGTVVVHRAAFASLPTQSYRSFKSTRAADFGYSSSLAHVYVHVQGAARTVTTAATPAVMQALTGTTWAAGNAGNDIYLGNIPISAETTLTVTGGAVTGPTTIPLSAGAFTYVTLVAN